MEVRRPTSPSRYHASDLTVEPFYPEVSVVWEQMRRQGEATEPRVSGDFEYFGLSRQRSKEPNPVDK